MHCTRGGLTHIKDHLSPNLPFAPRISVLLDEHLPPRGCLTPKYFDELLFLKMCNFVSLLGSHLLVCTQSQHSSHQSTMFLFSPLLHFTLMLRYSSHRSSRERTSIFLSLLVYPTLPNILLTSVPCSFPFHFSLCFSRNRRRLGVLGRRLASSPSPSSLPFVFVQFCICADYNAGAGRAHPRGHCRSTRGVCDGFATATAWFEP